ncbi:ribonuclease H-like domain-containing protein [Tanacetum coccineum]
MLSNCHNTGGFCSGSDKFKGLKEGSRQEAGSRWRSGFQARYNDIPLYSRFKQVEYKGVPHPLSGDYTPREQEDIDDSLYEYGKYGPQPQSPSPIESDASSTVSSTCQSNDSDGEQGTVSDHSVNDDPIPIPSSEQVSTSIQKTQPQVPKPQQTVDPSCAQATELESKNGKGIRCIRFFERNHVLCVESLRHLIKVVTYYEKKMAREAALKSKKVVHADVRQATPAWTNTNRVNKANQFTPRPVQLRLAVHVNTARVNRPVLSNQTSQVNLKSPKKCFSKQSSPVNRPFSRHTTYKSNIYAVKGKMGTAVKTSAGCVWRKAIPLSNINSGPTPDSNVNVSRGPQGRPKPVKAWGSLLRFQELSKWDLLLLEEVKVLLKRRLDNGTEFKNRVMLEFCGAKGIKQEFSNARTPQQNGVAEEKQLILLAIPSTGPLGKFDGKSDEGFLVGYSVNSKAFRVYNLVTKRVEVNLHVNFLEEKPNVQGIGHRWMFDLDYLTDSMNYIPVSVQNQANPAGSKEVIDIDVQTEEDADLMVVSSTSLSEKIATKKTHSPRQPSSTPISNTNPVNTGSINLNTAFEEVNTGNTEAISPSADHEEEVFSDADDDEMPEIRIYDK